MRTVLFPFQEEALVSLHENIKFAQSTNEQFGKNSVISLSSPTGSGKTIVIIKLYEEILFGSEVNEGNKNSIFLWLSDSPELNKQTQSKIEAQSNKINVNQIVQIEQAFDKEFFEFGHFYFLNTQKLGSDKKLTSYSDEREYTIWDTIENTARKYPSNFYLVIDEAHRGAVYNAKSEKKAQSIMQKFLLGSVEDKLSPVPLTIGVTATPERFMQLIKQSESLALKILLKPEDVRESGLIKDRIKIAYPALALDNEVTMLNDALTDWDNKGKQWKSYYEDGQDETLVKPIMVIQVADGSKDNISNTDLALIVATIEKYLGRELYDGELIQTFDLKSSMEIGGKVIPYVEPYRIQDDENIRFVLFKMNLSTGWDCPRAETMVSYRTANDATYIAQLLGRMVRTPLARRISTNSELNSVSLFLPGYDQETVNRVVISLQESDALVPGETGTKRTLVDYVRSTEFEELFPELNFITTYEVPGKSSLSFLKQYSRLSRLLTMNQIDMEAQKNAYDAIVTKMRELIEEMKTDGEFDSIRETIENIGINQIEFSVRDNVVDTTNQYSLIADVVDISTAFDKLKSLFDGLNVFYWSKYTKVEKNYRQLKLEVLVLYNSEKQMKKLFTYCENQFNDLYETWKFDIANQTEDIGSEFKRLLSQVENPIDKPFYLPEVVGYTVSDKSIEIEKHIYVDKEGKFKIELNGWEKDVVKTMLEKTDVYAWLRNPDRKYWSMCVPYEDGGKITPMFPDFIFIRKQNDKYVFDLFDPHDSNKKDNVPKIKGLARYAEKYWTLFPRIGLIRKQNGKDKQERYYLLNVSNTSVRKKVLKITTDTQLDDLFIEYGETL
ncbi:type III deoxyribonuclease [Salipaludibacillus neizhouensis]|uniref:Type III deoxyribonuclease n=1 Tax=Salipaludibacillus neizhouensis TaxID=885475 RepID=A0A3A9KA73_9BACI|nr:DEAD/DEAH box helicase family protein [Salipaludibacillus neizhouensis]RKL66473.1 type III deoxyribonuclease [Salipaludibacillus neizhouensis]